MNDTPTSQPVLCALAGACPLRQDVGRAKGAKPQGDTKEHFLSHIRENLATTMQLAEFKRLGLTRADFLDKPLMEYTDTLISRREPLPIHIVTHAEKDDFRSFSVSLFGVLLCGRKFHLRIRRVPLHVDILVTPRVSREEISTNLQAPTEAREINSKNPGFVRCTPGPSLYRITGFSDKKLETVRFHFAKSSSRKEFITMLEAENKTRRDSGQPLYESSSDKKYDVFTQIAAQHEIPTAGWAELRNYSLARDSETADSVLYFEADSMSSLSALPDEAKNDERYSRAFAKEYALACSWDTETYADNNEVPKPSHSTFQVTATSMLFHWHWSTAPLLSVCISRFDSAPVPDTLVIRVKDTAEMLSAFEYVASIMRPEYWVGFNCGGYDWDNFVILAERTAGGLVDLLDSVSSLKKWRATKPESITRWDFGGETIKYSAEFSQRQPRVVRACGSIHIDMMTQLGKLHPRAEIERGKSLNWYLAKYELEGKYDMAYERMHSIFRRALALESAPTQCHCSLPPGACAVCHDYDKYVDPPSGQDKEDTPELPVSTKLCCCCSKRAKNLADMAEVNYYAMRDCVGPMRLLVKAGLIQDKREIALLGYVSLYAAFYRADGNKVDGRLTWACHKKHTAFSSLVIRNANSDQDYKKQVRDWYPGGKVFPPIYGLHSDQPLTDQGKHILDAEGNPELGRPIVGLDFASLYPSEMRAYNLCPSKYVATREEAEDLASRGYFIYQTPLIHYERGQKRGSVDNPKFTGQAWFVRHNGIVAAEDKRIVAWVKTVNYVWMDETTMTLSRTSFRLARITTPGGLASAEEPLSINYTYEHDPLATVDYDAFPEDAEAHRKFLRESPRRAVPGRFDGKIPKGEMIRSISYSDIREGDGLPGEFLGVFPWVLHDLASGRSAVKKKLGIIDGLEKIMSRDGLDTIEFDGRSCSASDLRVEYAKIDGMQKALKVIMNTFYGKSGQQMSSYYNLFVAAGVTTSGQQSITRVAECVRRGLPGRYRELIALQCDWPELTATSCPLPPARVNYGDTDSCYASLTNAYFPREDGLYAVAALAASTPEEKLAARLAWWKDMVATTRFICEMYREECNDLMVAWSGTTYLSLAYEEVMYPTFLSGKKKYAGLAHVDDMNFFPPPNKIFVRGLDMIKQGFNQQVRSYGYKILAEILSPHNYESPKDIAEKHFLAAIAEEPDVLALAQKARYKDDKQNAKVITFVERMRRAYENCTDPELRQLYEPPQNGERFDYVIVAHPQQYTLSGAKKPESVGDTMEYVRVYLAMISRGAPMTLDKYYYLSRGGLIGMFVRFIVYDPRFEPSGEFDLNNNEQFTDYDHARVEKARAYLDAIVNDYLGRNASHQKEIGSKYQKDYKQRSKAMTAELKLQVGKAGATLVSAVISSKISLELAVMSAACEEAGHRMVDESLAQKKLAIYLGGVTKRDDLFNAINTYARKPNGEHYREMKRARAELASAEAGFREAFWLARESISGLRDAFNSTIEQFRQGGDGAGDSGTSRLLLSDPTAVNALILAQDRLTGCHRRIKEMRTILRLAEQKKASLSGLHMADARTRDLFSIPAEEPLPFSCGF